MKAKSVLMTGILILMACLIMMGCGGGGGGGNEWLVVGSIEGSATVTENTEAQYTVNAKGDTGIAYWWTCDPSAAGSWTNQTNATATFKAASVSDATPVTIRVMVESDNSDEPVNVQMGIVIKNQPIPNSPIDITPQSFWPGNVPGKVDIEGNHLYVLSTNFANEELKIHIFDISDSTNPVWKNSVHVNTPGNYVDMAVSDGYAYLAYEDEGLLQIVDVDPPGSVAVVKNLNIVPYDPQFNSVEGVDCANGYCYVGYFESPATGIKVIDVTHPDSASIVKTFKIGEYLCVYDVAVSGEYAYVTGDSGLSIIDINPLSAISIISGVALSECGEEISVAGGYAYVSAADSYQEHFYLHVVDVDPPNSPTLVKRYDAIDDAGCVGVTSGYACVANGAAGLYIIDANSFQITGSVDTPGYAWGVAVSGNIAYVGDVEGGLRIIKLW